MNLVVGYLFKMGYGRNIHFLLLSLLDDGCKVILGNLTIKSILKNLILNTLLNHSRGLGFKFWFDLIVFIKNLTNLVFHVLSKKVKKKIKSN